MSLKRPFVPKSDVKQRFTTTTYPDRDHSSINTQSVNDTSAHHRHFDPLIINPLITMATILTKTCSLAHFRKKLSSDLLLIWQICSAMSANDLNNFWDQTILKILAAILNFVLFTQLKKCKMTGP